MILLLFFAQKYDFFSYFHRIAVEAHFPTLKFHVPCFRKSSYKVLVEPCMSLTIQISDASSANSFGFHSKLNGKLLTCIKDKMGTLYTCPWKLWPSDISSCVLLIKKVFIVLRTPKMLHCCKLKLKPSCHNLQKTFEISTDLWDIYRGCLVKLFLMKFVISSFWWKSKGMQDTFWLFENVFRIDQ